MAHEEYKEMMVAQALSALDESEARALETHLQTCADCLAEMAEWQETTAWISLAASPREPSPEVRRQILQQLAADAAVEPQAKARVLEIPVREIPVRQMPVQASTGWRPAQRWGAIAAALVIVALVISLLALWRQNLNAKKELAQLSKQVEEARQQLASEREILSFVTTPGARVMKLAPSGAAPSAHGMLAYDQTGRAMLMAKDLPPPPTGKAYQLWFISGGKPLPGKVFTTNASGEGTLNDQIPSEALNTSVFAITLEPEGGVQKPTGKIYLQSGS